jgi:cytokinin dehydrogenase
VRGALPAILPGDFGAFGFVLIFPLKRAMARQPLFRLPESNLVFLFDILGTADSPGYNKAYAARMIARNRELFERARDVGGTRYPIGTLHFGQDDWQRHYGPEWERVKAAKASFDPRRILTPGPGIF